MYCKQCIGRSQSPVYVYRSKGEFSEPSKPNGKIHTAKDDPEQFTKSQQDLFLIYNI